MKLFPLVLLPLWIFFVLISLLSSFSSLLPSLSRSPASQLMWDMERGADFILGKRLKKIKAVGLRVP